MRDYDTTETMVEDGTTTMPEILDSPGFLKTTKPTYIPGFSYTGFVRQATDMLKRLFKDQYPITRVIKKSESQSTFVLKGIDQNGAGHVIKALVLPPGMPLPERERKKYKFARECDLVEGFHKIFGGKGIARVTDYGTKYPAKIKDSFDAVRIGTLPFTIPYFATAHLGGGDLERIVRHQFPMRKTINVFKQIAETVSFMHDHYYILHKDIKPANILFDCYDVPHLIDLGVVEGIGIPCRKAEAGSVPYLSPDQAKGFIALMCGGTLPVHTYRTDMYSFGMVLGDMIHKYNPRNPVDVWDRYFEKEDDFIAFLANDPIVIFPNSGVQELDDIIHRATSHDKKEQFSSMSAVYDALCKLECKL